MRAHGQGAVWGYRRAPHAAAYRRVGRRLRAADVCALSDTARCARPLRDAHAWLQHGECPAEGPLHRHVSRRRGRYGGHRRPGQGWKVREEESWQRKQARQHRPEYVVSHHSTSHDADVWHEHASQYCGGESFGSGPSIPTLTSACRGTLRSWGRTSNSWRRWLTVTRNSRASSSVAARPRP